MFKIVLPKGYNLIDQNNHAVLAHNPTKKEYVAWTKNDNDVVWGKYFPYWFNTPESEAYEDAYEAFRRKSFQIV